VHIEQRQDLCILRLRGRFLTGSNADYAHVRSRLGAAACRNVVVDCRAAPYLDSTGIAFVVGLYNLLSRFGGHVALANVSPRIREVLDITKLDGIIPAFDDEQTALAAVRSPRLCDGLPSADRHRPGWL
jgi:anti-anti-sigma factor